MQQSLWPGSFKFLFERFVGKFRQEIKRSSQSFSNDCELYNDKSLGLLWMKTEKKVCSWSAQMIKWHRNDDKTILTSPRIPRSPFPFVKSTTSQNLHIFTNKGTEWSSPETRFSDAAHNVLSFKKCRMLPFGSLSLVSVIPRWRKSRLRKQTQWTYVLECRSRLSGPERCRCTPLDSLRATHSCTQSCRNQTEKRYHIRWRQANELVEAKDVVLAPPRSDTIYAK